MIILPSTKAHPIINNNYFNQQNVKIYSISLANSIPSNLYFQFVNGTA